MFAKGTLMLVQSRQYRHRSIHRYISMDISILTKFYHGKLARAVFAAVADQGQVWVWHWD
ncbi:hypothetical protein [Neorhizobium alkalisoli]|uniref:hypothetical protein n=1 Tax=Neorhizobium alkalisoli TaxID=528178 RepID=UPI001648BEB4|nr:hypothetical protein [Neorhizobium alkalisoli]